MCVCGGEGGGVEFTRQKTMKTQTFHFVFNFLLEVRENIAAPASHVASPPEKSRAVSNFCCIPFFAVVVQCLPFLKKKSIPFASMLCFNLGVVLALN